MSELTIICAESNYELYNKLSRYFEVEMVGSNDGTMGVLDALKVLVDPISKTIEIIGNIIMEIINRDSCTIVVKNGEKEVSFDGKIKNLSNKEVMDMLSKVFEE